MGLLDWTYLRVYLFRRHGNFLFPALSAPSHRENESSGRTLLVVLISGIQGSGLLGHFLVYCGTHFIPRGDLVGRRVLPLELCTGHSTYRYRRGSIHCLFRLGFLGNSQATNLPTSSLYEIPRIYNSSSVCFCVGDF